MESLATSHTKWQHRGQRGVETEKIDFQVFSWKCLDFEKSPILSDKRVFVQHHQGGEGKLLRKTNVDSPSLVHRTRGELWLTGPAERTMLNARPSYSANIRMGTDQMSSKNHVGFFSFKKYISYIADAQTTISNCNSSLILGPQTFGHAGWFNLPHKPWYLWLAGALILSSWWSGKTAQEAVSTHKA